MKILRFSAENVKGIKAVELSPNGDVVTISGKNGQGKSSILDSIQATLCGGDLEKTAGAKRGQVVIDLGDYTIKRVITEKGDRLDVSNKDGAVYKSPREMLSKLIGLMSIDPLAFIRLKTKEQVNVIYKLTPGLEGALKTADEKIESIKAERSNINRDMERVEWEMKSMPVNEGVPEEELSITDVMDEMQKAIDHNASAMVVGEKIKKAVEDEKVLVFNISKSKERQKSIESQIADMQKQLKEVKAQEVELNRQLTEQQSKAKLLIKLDEIDLAPIRAKSTNIQETNRKVRMNKDRVAKAKALEVLKESYSAKLKEMRQSEEDKAKALTDAKLPLTGLSVQSCGVVYNGIPIDQLSTAEKVRVGASLAVAQNPKAKIILADDVSLLDKSNLTMLHEICAGFQLWQVVNDESGNIGFYIESGYISLLNGEKIPKPVAEKKEEDTEVKTGMF